MKFLDNFADHFNQVLNFPGSTDHRTLDSISKQPVVYSLDELPDEKELSSAIERMNENQVPGRCCIPGNCFARADSQFSLKIHIKKTECS